MFSFTEEQRSIQEMVRDYAQKVLKSRAEEIDKTGRYPAESIKELAEMGVMGLNISEEYGGAGMDTVSKVLAIARGGQLLRFHLRNLFHAALGE